jgi:site-specific recombinase XerD
MHFDQLKAFYPNKALEELSEQDIWQYLKFLIERKQASAQTVHQAVYAFLFVFNTILGKNYDLKALPVPKRIAEVPEILTQDEIRLILQNASTLRQRTVFAIIYSAGLDTGEAASLRVADVDTKNRVLTVRTPAGKIARKAILSEYVGHMLKDYMEEYRPTKWLFEGQKPDSHYSTDSIQQSFKKTKNAIGIVRDVTARSLRYSYIKHLEQEGVPLSSILKELGMFTNRLVL